MNKVIASIGLVQQNVNFPPEHCIYPNKYVNYVDN